MLHFTKNIYLRVGHVVVDKHGDSFTVIYFRYGGKTANEKISHIVAKCNTDEEVREIEIAELTEYFLEF